MSEKNEKQMAPAKVNLLFPDEILIQILSRLPVKSLVRLRCVSKSFLTLITSPHFVQLHLKQSALLNPKIFYATLEDTYSIDYQTSHVPKPYSFSTIDHRIIGSCNGLICISDKFDCLELWNPATKECVPFAEIEEEADFDLHEVVMGFGYDSAEDKYKLVRFVFMYSDVKHTHLQQCEVKVYTLGTEEWRRIDDPPCALCNRHKVPQLNGALHWLTGLPIDSSAKMLDSRIVAFDVGGEKFRLVPWIKGIRSDDAYLDVTLGVLQDCLSTLCWCYGDISISVWSMKDYGVKESWTKLFSIQMPLYMVFEDIEPLVLRSHGQIILKHFGKLYVHDTSHSRITVHNICDTPSECYKAHTFVESLISIASLVHEGKR